MSDNKSFGISWNNAPRHTTPSRQTTTSVDESEGLRCRVRAAASLFLFLVAQDRKLSLSGCLGRAEGAKSHVRNSNGDAAIEVSSVSSVFLLACSVFVMVSRSSRRKSWACGRHGFLGAATGVRCAMVCGRGRNYCSGRLSLKFAFYRLDRGHRNSQESPQTAPKVLTHHEHATSRLINSQIPNEHLKESHEKGPQDFSHILKF